MKILVTGGKGAIGGRLMEALSELGHEPVSYDLVDGQDIFDLAQLEAAVESVDAVYHLAAEANLNCMRDVEGAHRGAVLNVGGTERVAYLCAKYAKWLLYVSTVCVYGDTPDIAREDTTLPNPSEIYAASKYAGEWIVVGYGKSLALPYTIIRMATPYGRGTRLAMAVHVFFIQALKGEAITIHGDGTQERTMTHIDDVIEGTVAPLAHKSESLGQIFNISTAERTSVKQMAEQIKALTGSQSPIVFGSKRPHDTMKEDIDTAKSKKMLGWEAKVSFKEGLAKTLPWIKQIAF
jgi:nucleoside-diphosphate-sugar epimerase